MPSGGPDPLDGPDRGLLERVERGLVDAPLPLPDAGPAGVATPGEGLPGPRPPHGAAADLSGTVEAALARARPSRLGGAYMEIDADGARAAARPGGRPGGPLERFVVAVKDLVAVRGLRLGAGSPLRRETPAEPVDAWIVATLRHAGAVVLGTTALHELAFGVTGVNPHFGTPHHPDDPTRVPGGSSSGSAVAVAEGSARVAVGTDTGGSVRIPAALCGVVGFKPAFATYPVQGVLPLAPTLDHLGLHARSVADAAEVHRLLVGEAVEARRPGRIGFDPRTLEGCSAGVERRVRRALERLRGAAISLVDVHLPDAERVFAASTAILFAEAAAVHRADLEARPELFGADVRRRLHSGTALPASTYLRGLGERRRVMAELADVLAGVDCVVGPTVPREAPTVEEAADPAVPASLVTHTRLANLTGRPALSLPLPGEGLPAGLQVTAATNTAVLGIAWFLEGLLA